MKKLLVTLVAILFSSSAFAAFTAVEIDYMNNKFGKAAADIQMGTLLGTEAAALDTAEAAIAILDSSADNVGDGLQSKKLMHSTFDVAVDGGTIGAIDLGEDLPANAIVTQAYFQIITQFTDAGSGTVALHCAGADDLFAAADITGSAAGTITSGVPVGTAATMFDVGTACDVTATVAGADQSAGKMVIWIEYVVSE